MDVIGICEKCGAFVAGVHIYRDGTVGFDAEMAMKHQESSPACAGACSYVPLASLKMAEQRRVKKNGRPPADAIRPSLIGRLVASFHRWRLGKPAARRG